MNDSHPPIPSSVLESHAARAWLCRLATGFAAGADLVRFLCDDRARDGRQRFEGEPTADALLRAWEAEGVVVRGPIQRLTPEQQINARGAVRLPNHYGWAPGPAYRAPVAWVDPPRPAPPSWQRAIDEHNALPRGTRDAEGFLLVPCPGGGRVVSGANRHEVAPGGPVEGYCAGCSQRITLDAEGWMPKHLTADLLAPRAEVGG